MEIQSEERNELFIEIYFYWEYLKNMADVAVI